MGTRRYVYNKVLDAVLKRKERVNFFELRNKYVIKKNNPIVSDWETLTPKDIRASAVKDLVNNMESNFELLKRRQIRGFQLSYSSKKDRRPSIGIAKSAIKLDGRKLFIYNTYLKTPIKITKRDHIPPIDRDCRLQIINNQWFLCVPYIERRQKIMNGNAFCSLDPGVRSFQTIYSNEEVVQIKTNTELINKLHAKLDTFRSLRKWRTISRSHWKRRENKVNIRIGNLKDELHYKTINYITNYYKVIFIPKFETQGLAKKIKNKNINRNLMMMSHFTFRSRLKIKAFEKGCYVDECTEEYTSQTCGNCGSLHKISSSDIYKCPSCSYTIDRDVNGARNIAIKRLNGL